MKSNLILILATAMTLAACGDNAPTATVAKAAEAHITGVVLNEDAPVTLAKIEAHDRNGKRVAETMMNGKDRYDIKLPPGTAYPVILTATPEGQSTALKAAITSDLVAEQDVSSVTTIVVDTALSLGGLTEANLAKAARAAISQRRTSGGSGSSSGFKGDPTKQYGGWH